MEPVEDWSSAGDKPEGTGKKTDQWAARGAEKIYQAPKAKGLKPIGPAAKFYVLDIKGPLDEGEEDRALSLGREEVGLLPGQGEKA